MKNALLIGTAFALVLPLASAKADLLTTEVFDGATLIDTVTSASGSLNLSTTDANFSTISATVVGVPQIANPDLSSVTLNVQSATAGTHTLTIDVFQTGVSAAAGTTLLSSGTTNDLVGAPGPTVETTYFNGADTTLGTQLATHTFPAGDVSDAFGPTPNVLGSALNADAQQYMVTFTAAGQSSNDTIQITEATAVPGPVVGSGVPGMVAAGLALVWFGRRRVLKSHGG